MLSFRRALQSFPWTGSESVIDLDPDNLGMWAQFAVRSGAKEATAVATDRAGEK